MMINQRKESPRPTMEEIERTVERCMERMMNEAREFAEMVQKNQTTFPGKRKETHDEDWNVGGP